MIFSQRGFVHGRGLNPRHCGQFFLLSDEATFFLLLLELRVSSSLKLELSWDNLSLSESFELELSFSDSSESKHSFRAYYRDFLELLGCADFDFLERISKTTGCNFRTSASVVAD